LVEVKLFSNFYLLQDIGCNVGAMTLEIGRRFAAKSLLGIDIDPELIRMAKKFAENLRDYQVTIFTDNYHLQLSRIEIK
jgi:trans-aconitate methyltransferase